ncbi:MAG: helix-turn-helix domain-containing protein, partial [Streptosporangiaceae bacterium]
MTAARALFGVRGFADVGTEEIVQAAGVTRGALYHQFRDKADLFAAVAEEVEAEIAERIAGAAGMEAGSVDALRSGARLFLDACAAPDVERIILLDAPAVPRRGSSASRSSTGSCVASWPAPERP